MSVAAWRDGSGLPSGETESPADAAPQFELPAGTVLEGRYRIVRGIGGGGMGQVYEAVHLRLGHRVAIKFLRDEQAKSGSRRRRFEREAHVLAQIQNEHVVRVFDFGVGTAGQPFLVMDLLL